MPWFPCTTCDLLLQVWIFLKKNINPFYDNKYHINESSILQTNELKYK